VRISGEYGRYLATMLRYALSLNILEAAITLRTADKYEPRDYRTRVNNTTLAYAEKACLILEGASEEEVGYELNEYWGEDAEEVVARARSIRSDIERRWNRELALSEPLEGVARVLNETTDVRRLGKDLTVGEVAQAYRADPDDPARERLMRLVPLSEEELGEKVERWEQDHDSGTD